MRNDFRVALFLVAGCIGVAVIVVLINTVAAVPAVGWVIVGLVGVIGLLAFGYVVYALLDRITGHHHEISTRKLARQSEIDRQHRERLLEQRAWEREQQQIAWEQQQRAWEREQQLEKHQRELELERERLQLERQRIQLEAYKAQAVHVKDREALIIREYDGLGTRTAYEPRVRVEEWKDTELVPEPTPANLIEGPRRHAVSALGLLQAGELGGDDIVLGVGADGELVRRTWRQLMSILILGLMGGGKTNTALWIVFQLLSKGYKVALIDRHAKSDESTHARLKGFSNAYDTPVGDSVAAASRVVKHVRRVFEDRRDQGAPINYRLIFVCDEFTATMRAAGDKTSEWQEVAIALAGLVEDLNSEGRKYGVHVICMGQAANASRGGGTEVRDLFHTRVIHGMRARQAQMLGLTDEKHAIQKLETGQVYVDIEGKDDPFPMQVPEVTAEFTRAVLALAGHHQEAPKTPVNEQFNPRSVWVPEPKSEVQEPHTEPSVNTVPHVVELVLPERAQRVLDLKKAGSGKAAIILEIWQVKKGGSAAYKQAEAEYTQIIENLVKLGQLQTQK